MQHLSGELAPRHRSFLLFELEQVAVLVQIDCVA